MLRRYLDKDRGWSYLRDAKETRSVTQFPVTELVGKDRENLIGFRFFQQSIVDDNVLLPWQTVEESIGVSAALAAVNDVQLVQGEFEPSGQFVNLGLELAILEGRQLVEQRLDEGGVQSGHQNLHGGGKDPSVKDELGASLLDNLEETSENRGHQGGSQEVGLDDIRDEQAGRLLVEAKLLFQDKGAVDLGRQTQSLLDEHEGEDEDDGVGDFAGEARGRVFQQQITGPGPQFGHDIELDKGEVDDLAPEAAGDGEFSLGAAIGLRLVEIFLGDFFGEDGGGFGRLEDTVLAEGEERFEDELAQGEAQDEPLPWEQRTVEKLRQAL